MNMIQTDLGLYMDTNIVNIRIFSLWRYTYLLSNTYTIFESSKACLRKLSKSIADKKDCIVKEMNIIAMLLPAQTPTLY